MSRSGSSGLTHSIGLHIPQHSPSVLAIAQICYGRCQLNMLDCIAVNGAGLSGLRGCVQHCVNATVVSKPAHLQLALLNSDVIYTGTGSTGETDIMQTVYCRLHAWYTAKKLLILLACPLLSPAAPQDCPWQKLLVCFLPYASSRSKCLFELL